MALETEAATATRPSTDGAEAAASGSVEVQSPATGETIGTVQVDGPERVAATVARVRAAQPEWESLGIKGRSRWLEQLRDWMFDHADQIGDTLQAETGKVRADAEQEVPYLASVVNFYGKKAKKFIGEETVRPSSGMLLSKKLKIQYRPFQVVGIISPWNFPLILSLGDAIAALQAGCAVVIKPSEVTPLSLGEIVTAWKQEIGGPDVLDVVNGKGETGAALVDEVDFVQFTGSDVTGKKVMARAAETLTPVSLELGGNDPLIVLEGADLERAVNAATFGAFANTGQACTSVERLYVQESIYDEFVSRLTEEVKKLNQGADGREYGMEQGAMTFPPQLDKVDRHVRDARDKGASVLAGGEKKDGPGQWYAPTVIADVDDSMEISREETFGPVVGVRKFSDPEEAIALANSSRHGLSGNVFGPKREAERVARRLEAGSVNVNDVLISFLATDVPMGGWKDSGIGFRHGEYGIKKYTRPESLVITRFGGKREPYYYPFTAKRRGTVNRLARLVNARGRKRFGR